MRLGLSYSVLDKASPELKRLAGEIRNPEALLMPVARQGANLLRKHFRELELSRPNKLGGPRQHWYARTAQSVNNPQALSAESARIDITQVGLALRLAGGVVTAKSGKALAIPVSPESYGVWARDWTLRHPERPLFKIRGARGMYLAARVADSRESGASRKRGASSSLRPRRLQILYALRQSAKIPADPTLLPPAAQFEASLGAYARQRLETLKSRMQ